MPVQRPLQVQSGYWATRLMLLNNPVLASSHRARFRFAHRLLSQQPARKLLDYGCGDGALFTIVRDLFPELTGVDGNSSNVADCRRRFAAVEGTRFLTVAEISDSVHDGAYDVVTCFEVLQCCLEADVEKVLAEIARLVSPEGRVILSVPIESGPALLIKHAVRMVALRHAQERDRYAPSELLRMTFATTRTSIERMVNSGRYDYKGFNWRAARVQIGRKFRLRETHFSPLGWSRGLLSTQAWLVCQPYSSRL